MEVNADYRYRGMMQPSQRQTASCVKGVEWGFGTRCLRMVAAFWAGISVEVTHEAGVVPRCRRGAIGHRFSRLLQRAWKWWAFPLPQG